MSQPESRAVPGLRALVATQAQLRRARDEARRARSYVGRVRQVPAGVSALQAEIRQLSELVTASVRGAEDQRAHVEEDLDILRDELRRLLNREHAAEESIVALAERLRSLSEDVRGMTQPVVANSEHLSQLERMVDVLRRKQEGVSLNLRERLATRTRANLRSRTYRILFSWTVASPRLAACG